jgi:hypothetical protein
MPGSLSGTTVTVSPVTTTTYTVTGTAANGCTATATRTITVNPTPTVTATATSTTICSGSSTTLSASGATTYNWMPGNHNGTPWTVSPATTTTYTVTGTSTGCSSTATQLITVNPTPTVTTTTTSGTICSGNSTTITASGATTYSWMPGSLSGTTVTVSPATTTTYTVTGTSTGCTATATRTITVNPSPTVTATATSTSICAGSSTTLSASGATTYNWMPGNHNGANWTVTPAATTTYTVTGTSGGCTNTATVLITVTPTPTVTTTTTGGTICSGNSTTITASGATTYNWMPGSLSGTTVTVSPATTTTYTVTGTSGGCSSTATQLITVNPSPTVTTTTTGGTICSGNSTTITASGATTYNWMPGSLSGTTVTVSPASTTTYTVTGTSGGCSSTATQLITVNPTPTVTTTTTGGTICSGNSTTITASGATTYSWMPGSLSGITVTVSPATTTTYTVTGTSTGCSSTTTQLITVNPTPTVTTTTTGGTICSGNSTTITASGATTYSWMPGSLSGTTVTVSPATTTTYTVTGTSTGCTTTATRTITVNPSPTVSATATSTSICAGSSTTLSASGATTYNWMPGNHNGANWTVTPAATTTYTVTGTSTGCSSTATQLITVNPNPTVAATTTNATICAGSSTTLSASGATTYTWMPGNLSGASQTLSPATTTTYSVTGTDANGCTGTDVVSITVNALPIVTASASNNTICIGNSITLTASGASTYNWMPPNANGASITDAPLATTTYTVTGTDVNGCINTANVSVAVNALPVVTATSSSSNICTGSSVTLTASGASTYNWMPPNASGVSITDIPAATTSYTVTGTDVNGCINTATVSVTVNPLPDIVVSGDTLVCPGNAANLNASGATTYSWMPGSLTGNSVSVSPSSPTTYSVTGTDANGCSNSSTIFVNIDTPPSAPSITVNGNTMTSTVTGATYQWFLNGNPISGATNQSYTATQNGTYTVEVYDAAGCGSGQSSGIDPTGISVSQSVDFISLFPNPNDGHFHLSFTVSKTGNYVLEIHNMLGQIVYSENLNNFSGDFEKDIDLSVYGKGVYTIRLGNGEKESVIKTVVY